MLYGSRFTSLPAYFKNNFQAEYFGNHVTMLVFGVTALVAAAITMTLPESKNIKLPDTVVEAERIGIDRLLPENIENS